MRRLKLQRVCKRLARQQAGCDVEAVKSMIMEKVGWEAGWALGTQCDG